MKSCIICKNAFEKSNFKLYCSHECYLKSPRLSDKAIILPCEYCGLMVLKYKSHLINKVYCNRYCSGMASGIISKKQVDRFCGNCNTVIQVKLSNTYTRSFKEEKLNFCSKHCKGTYDSTIPKGIHDPNSSFVKNRSALELFIEEKIKSYFPYITLNLNNRSVLGLELDFYFPTLNLAFEINGLVHYKAIYGEDMFTKIQEKDNRKIRLCEEKKIDLIIIKSTVRFYESVGETIWNEEIKPELLKRIPFCENEMNITPTLKINPIKQLFQNRKK